VIRVKRVARPGSLDGPASPGGIETAAAIAYFAQATPNGDEPKFAAYKKEDVRAALLRMFGAKCAYCEFEYEGGAPPDIEHYRPKKEIERPDKTKIKPGYYWLAADWKNLLPTCIDCNRRRRQTVKGEVLPAGKGIKFPLADESKRARLPGREIDEKPLLLDPTVDNPAAHLSYDKAGTVRATESQNGESPRGRATIEVLGLNRRGLVRGRKAVRLWLEEAIGRFSEAERELEIDPDNEFARRQRDKARREMKKRARRDQPYAGMVRERLRDFL
jgi:uncharacterized protein (TIGR02646 family)